MVFVFFFFFILFPALLFFGSCIFFVMLLSSSICILQVLVFIFVLNLFLHNRVFLSKVVFSRYGNLYFKGSCVCFLSLIVFSRYTNLYVYLTGSCHTNVSLSLIVFIGYKTLNLNL